MGKFAAYLNAALAVAWTALFFTNDALFVSHEVDLSDHLRGDAFAMAWAGSAICSRLYIALVNYGVELRYATAIFVIPSLAVGVLAALATSSFTSLAWAMVLLARREPTAFASRATVSARHFCLPVIGRHLSSPRTARRDACR